VSAYQHKGLKSNGSAGDVGWITFTSGNMGIGKDTVNYAVAANQTGLSRKGRITVGGKVFTVKQK